jgi:hypothetical protein
MSRILSCTLLKALEGFYPEHHIVVPIILFIYCCWRQRKVEWTRFQGLT